MMLKELFQYVVGLSKAEVQEVNGYKYTDKRLTRIDEELRAEQIQLTTLKSLVEYIKSGTDKFKGKLFVHVVSPSEVELISELDCDRKRETLAYVTAMLPKIRLNEFVDNENFIIMMQSQFCPDEDKEIVMQVAGNVIDKTVADYGDTGISQKATIRTGIASSSDVEVPNPVRLSPYRTFQEIEQVACDFVFRMKQSERGVLCALFEADGGAWRNEAVNRISLYLQEELEDTEDYITVIS